MKIVEIDEDAEVELIESITWYEEREEGVGLRFATDVDARVSALPNVKFRPLRGYEDCGAQFVEVGDPWPFRIIAVERPSLIRVVAFAHHSRRPGYWAYRLTR